MAKHYETGKTYRLLTEAIVNLYAMAGVVDDRPIRSCRLFLERFQRVPHLLDTQISARQSQ